MVESSASSATVAAHRETARWPPAWLANVGVVIGIGLVVLLSSLAIAGAATSMTENGASVEDLQTAGPPPMPSRPTTTSAKTGGAPPGGFSYSRFPSSPASGCCSAQAAPSPLASLLRQGPSALRALPALP
jgi:hypothetical protein